MRHFNFRHEWGMELIYYLVLSRTVPHLPADLLLRDDWLAWRRSGSLYRGLAASLIARTLAALLATDRAYLATAVMVTLTVAAFERRRCLWLFPRPGFFVWANWHGGYVMGDCGCLLHRGARSA